MYSTLMIFLDGVGIGEYDHSKNIFFKRRFKFLENIFGKIPSLENQNISVDGKYIFPVDACMGIPGLPQSGTGQTSIFCGINAPQMIGQHFGPYPYSTLIPEIKAKNIFKTFLDRNYKVSFVNAYPKIFFDYINSGRKRLSVTSLSCLLTGVRLKTATDLRRGNALSAEIDNARWFSKLGYTIPVIKPETAAKRLFKICRQNHFTLFEYFLTDHIGHGRIADIEDYTLNVLDDFLYFIITNLPEDISLVICSDHGNIEDRSFKGHTRNPALAITAGYRAEELSIKIKFLYDIKPAILEMYD